MQLQGLGTEFSVADALDISGIEGLLFFWSFIDIQPIP